MKWCVFGGSVLLASILSIFSFDVASANSIGPLFWSEAEAQEIFTQIYITNFPINMVLYFGALFVFTYRNPAYHFATPTHIFFIMGFVIVAYCTVFGAIVDLVFLMLPKGLGLILGAIFVGFSFSYLAFFLNKIEFERALLVGINIGIFNFISWILLSMYLLRGISMMSLIAVAITILLVLLSIYITTYQRMHEKFRYLFQIYDLNIPMEDGKSFSEKHIVPAKNVVLLAIPTIIVTISSLIIFSTIL
ncbi:MAG: hypothetical protein QCI38_00080 [Candidatus Thermoplasmatota archaeon]|nr:hypothetical protein [Candidatus Thermoplasmatota archaeon]